jgi:exodeoxyribonuclease III
MRIATWNVNSIKMRRERLLAWLQQHEPDILCLQELKGIEEQFPFEDIQALGYEAAVFGQKTYNGVAIISKSPLERVQKGFNDGVEDPQARMVHALTQGVHVICVYVPNGSTLDSEKYPYKLAWLDRLLNYLKKSHSPDQPLVVCGDFNCAPDDRDIHRINEWSNTVLTTDAVRQSVNNLCEWGLVDTFRHNTQDAGLYSWWDYRGLGFPKNNGLRIDMVYATAALSARSTGCFIDRNERKGKKPSDHAPVVTDFDLGSDNKALSS